MNAQEYRHPLLAGAITGALEIMCTYPFEYVKTQLQLAAVPAATATAATAASAAAPTRANGSSVQQLQFRGSADVIRRTVAQHGWLGLYRGLSSNLAFSFPRSGIRFSVYEAAANALTGHAGSGRRRGLSAGETLAAGAAAGLVEALVTIIPMTTIQVKMVQDLNRPDGPRYKGLVHAVRCIVAAEGLGGLYRGVGPTLLKIVFNISLRFLLYDALCGRLGDAWDTYVTPTAPVAAGGGSSSNSSNNNSNSNATSSSGSGSSWKFNAVSLAAGAAAGAVTVVANHPVDVVKSNMQSLHAARYGGSSAACLRDIWASEGLAGCYKGLIPRLNRVVLETSLSFTFYQHVSRAANVLLDGRP